MANFTIEIYHDMLLVRKGRVYDNRFNISDMKVEYDNLRESYHVSTLHQYPLYFLEHESFYHLKWKHGRIKTHTPSAKFVRENIEYAYLDNALWDLLQDEETRNFLKDSIINHYMK